MFAFVFLLFNMLNPVTALMQNPLMYKDGQMKRCQDPRRYQSYYTVTEYFFAIL